MLVNAFNYEDEILKAIEARRYDPRYKYYFQRTVNRFSIRQNNSNEMMLVSVSEQPTGLVLHGYISYMFDVASNKVFNYGAISFDIGSPTFARDIGQSIVDIFEKYGFNGLDFFCIADNPVIKAYRKLIARVGGREVGTFRAESMQIDGKLHDSVMFEIMSDDYFAAKGRK